MKVTVIGGAEHVVGKREFIQGHLPQLLSFIDTRRTGELLSWNSQFHWRDALDTID